MGGDVPAVALGKTLAIGRAAHATDAGQQCVLGALQYHQMSVVVMGRADARDHAVILQHPYGADELPGFGSAIHVRVRGKGKALAKARGKLFVGPAAHHACQLQHGGRVGLARVFGQSIFVLRLFFVSPKGCGGVGRVSRVGRVGSIGIAGQLLRAYGRYVALPIGLPLLRQGHEYDRKHGRIGQVGRQGWGG